MYIDPNVGGMLFQAFAAAFAVTGIALVVLRQIRSGLVRLRRRVRVPVQKSEIISTRDRINKE